MSIETNDPTKESVETTELHNEELSKDEADNTAGGHKKHWEHGGGGDGGNGGDGGDGGGLKFT